MNKVRDLEIPAAKEQLDTVMDFIREQLEEVMCPMKVQMQIELAVEEIFINIASYAYKSDMGTAIVRTELISEPLTVIITFKDHGIPYDPLANDDPDISLSAEDRPIGGLGIFLAKKNMDDIAYEYHDGQNILTLKKSLSI